MKFEKIKGEGPSLDKFAIQIQDNTEYQFVPFRESDDPLELVLTFFESDRRKGFLVVSKKTALEIVSQIEQVVGAKDPTTTTKSWEDELA